MLQCFKNTVFIVITRVACKKKLSGTACLATQLSNYEYKQLLFGENTPRSLLGTMNNTYICRKYRKNKIG